MQVDEPRERRGGSRPASTATPRRTRRALGVVSLFVTTLSVIMAAPSRASDAPPDAGGYFRLAPVGSALPSPSQCSARVHRSSWEPRPENAEANRTVPPSVTIPGYTPDDGYDGRARSYADRVDGHFQGTTDEIIQWGACKWGAPDNMVRSMAVAESSWYQGVVDESGRPVDGRGYGDFTNDASQCQDGFVVPCPESFGLLEVKATSEPGTFPYSRDSTAFNVDYALMVWRVCFEGWTKWLADFPGGTTRYTAGDLWGCVGFWYSGNWYGSGGGYRQTVESYNDSRPWLSWPDRSQADNNARLVSVDDNVTGTGTNEFQYVGTWWSWAEPDAYLGGVHGSWETNDYYQVLFKGSRVAVYGTVGPGKGTASVSIDGGEEVPVSFSADVPSPQKLVYISPILPVAAHVIRVRNTGSGTLIDADRVVVYNTSCTRPRRSGSTICS